jgi:hypothetical protein
MLLWLTFPAHGSHLVYKAELSASDESERVHPGAAGAPGRASSMDRQWHPTAAQRDFENQRGKPRAGVAVQLPVRPGDKLHAGRSHEHEERPATRCRIGDQPSQRGRRAVTSFPHPCPSPIGTGDKSARACRTGKDKLGRP